MTKITKSCCIRLPVDLHRLAKLKAYEEGKTLQSWLIEILSQKLEVKIDR